jgi:iron-sulfur cluster assembly protein
LQTESAASRISSLLARRVDVAGIRLGVRSRGCNGLSYTLEYVGNDGNIVSAPQSSPSPSSSAAAVAVSTTPLSSSSKAKAKAATSVALDEKVTEHGVTVFIDPKALFYVVGTQMDYVVDDLSAQFVFSNPNKKGECGCGESFSVGEGGSSTMTPTPKM